MPPNGLLLDWVAVKGGSLSLGSRHATQGLLGICCPMYMGRWL